MHTHLARFILYSCSIFEALECRHEHQGLGRKYHTRSPYPNCKFCKACYGFRRGPSGAVFLCTSNSLKHAVWLRDGNDHEARVCDDAIIFLLSLKVKCFGS